MATAVATTSTTTSTNGTTTASSTAVGQSAKDGQYAATGNVVTTAGYKRPGSIMEVREPMDLVCLNYTLDPAKVTQFQEFYKTKIQAWMRKRGVRHAHAYVAGTTFVVLASIQADVPWIPKGDKPTYGVEPIEGFADYLANEQPEVIELPRYFQNPRTDTDPEP